MDRRNIANQKGFTLVEVLVAIVILSIGLLGVAGMQVSGMKGNHNSYLRSQALQYAYEMLDMMRANREAATAEQATTAAAFLTATNYPDNYSVTFTEFLDDTDSDADGVPDFESELHGGTFKTGQVLADLQEWRHGIVGTANGASGLPGGRGSVTVTPLDEDGDGTAGETWLVSIAVGWTEARLADDTTPSVLVETKL